MVYNEALVREYIENKGYESLLFALSMMKIEHPNREERFKFMGRSLAQLGYIIYFLNTTYAKAIFQSGIIY